MKHSFKIKYILVTPLLGALLISIIALFLLHSVSEAQKKYLLESFSIRVQQINDRIDKHTDFITEYSEQFINELKNDPQIVYAAIYSNDKVTIFPSNFISIHQIRHQQEGRITEYNQKQILPVKLPLVDKRFNQVLELYAGLKADELLKDYSAQRNFVIIVISVFLLLAVLLVFWLDRFLQLPLKRAINKMGLLAGGQTNISGEQTIVAELQTMNTYLEKIDYYILLLKKRSHKLEESRNKKTKEIQRVKENLNNELELMYSLAQLPVELNEENDTDSLFHRLNKILTRQFKFDFSFVFLHKGEVYQYHSSEVKGLQMVNEKLAASFAEYRFDPDTIRQNGQIIPFVSEKPPFAELLQKMNINGVFAHLPIPQIGLLVVGYLDQKKRIKQDDLRRLLMISHIIAYRVENLEAIDILRRSLRIRTNELESSHQFLMESLQERDAMIKLVSHDLKAPLRNVSGLVDSIRRKYDDQLSKDIQERLNRIKSNMDKEMKMVEDILDSFKALEQKEQSDKVDLNIVVQRIRDELQFEIDQQNISFTVDSQLPVFYSNEHIIEHVLLNIIDNACKSFDDPRGNNRIKITAAETNHEVIIRISDNGRGIPKDKQETIFKPFTQLSTGQSARKLGVGLGLALIRNFMEKINGRIQLESAPGKGSTFILHLKK